MLLAVGLILGVAVCLTMARIVTSKVFLVPLLDPISFVVKMVTLGAAALLACWLPARRATNVDPMVTLRTE